MSDLSTIWVYFKGQILPFLINAGLKKGKISLFSPQKLFWKMSKHLRIIQGYRWTIILGHLFILQFSQNFLWLSLSQFENMSFYKSPNIYSLITVHHPKLDFITKNAIISNAKYHVGKEVDENLHPVRAFYFVAALKFPPCIIFKFHVSFENL